jgi:DNA-directed RNA polymerase specialized sigma24 family protein
MRHDYTNELELKSILIRIKNARIEHNTVKTAKTIPNNEKASLIRNRRIAKYILWNSRLQHTKKTSNPKKAKEVQEFLKTRIIELSESTSIDTKNYEKFGNIVMTMVRHILTKAQFRGYSYYDDFMSDSVYKVLKYLDNFDHTKKSKISGQSVNAFAYLSTIIHNAIIYIIKKKKKEQQFIQEQVNYKRIEMGLPIINFDVKDDTEQRFVKVSPKNTVKKISDAIENNKEFIKSKNNTLNIEYITDEPLDIDELIAIQEYKKMYKNVKITEGIE